MVVRWKRPPPCRGSRPQSRSSHRYLAAHSTGVRVLPRSPRNAPAPRRVPTRPAAQESASAADGRCASPSTALAWAAPRVTSPHPCRAAVDSLAHSAELPSALVARVPQREKLILSFVLAFIKDQAPPHAAPALCPRPRPRLCPSPSRLPSPLPPPPPPPSPSPSPAPSARALRPQPSPRRSDLPISPRACRRSCSSTAATCATCCSARRPTTSTSACACASARPT